MPIRPAAGRLPGGAAPVASVTNYGSALKILRAWRKGAADLYPRLGRTMEWDTAGPQAVLEAAGGRLSRIMAGATGCTYGKPVDGRTRTFICLGL